MGLDYSKTGGIMFSGCSSVCACTRDGRKHSPTGLPLTSSLFLCYKFHVVLFTTMVNNYV